MAQLRDLTEIFDPNLYLPIKGKSYRVAAVSKTEADRLRPLLVTALSYDDERAEVAKVLGPTQDEMVADGITDAEIHHAGRTALMWFGGGPKLGAAHWHMHQLGELVDTDRILAEARAMREARAGAPQTTPNRQARRRRRR